MILPGRGRACIQAPQTSEFRRHLDQILDRVCALHLHGALIAL